MVTVNNELNNSEFDQQNPRRTLCDWVRQFRLKKIQMKRKLKMGSDLRVCAILTTALMRTELELKRKQQERFQRWLEFQEKIQSKTSMRDDNNINVSKKDNESSTQHNKQQQGDEIENIWKCELRDLDEFLRSISSVNVNKCNNGTTLTTLTNNNCKVISTENRQNNTTLRSGREQNVFCSNYSL